MLEQADNTLIMDDQQQRSLDRGGCRPSNRTPHPSGIPGELTFMQPELVDLLTARATPHLPLSAPAGARHAACQTTIDPPCRDSYADSGDTT